MDVETAALASAALEAHAAPRPSTADGPDPRTHDQRLMDGFRNILGIALVSKATPRNGAGIHVYIVMTLDQLTGRPNATPEIAGGTIREPISAGAARRRAADAGIIPVVLGGDSEILDLGRTQRHASRGQRRALLFRDRTCVEPTCDRPAAW